MADRWGDRFLFPGSIRREGVDCLAADLGRKFMAKIMKDTAQEQALLEVADLLQQLKILDNSTKNPESSLSCTYRVGGGRMQRLPISENYLVSMIATVQTDLQKKINNLCKKYRIELEADESALMGTGIGDDIE